MTYRSRLKKKKQKKGNERRGNAKAAQQARQNLKNTAKKIEEKITQSSARTQGSSSYGGNAPGRRGGSNNTQTPSASTSINRRNERQTQYYGGISKGGKVKSTAERMKERTEARELQRDNIRRGNKNAAPHRMDSNVQNSLRDRLKQSQQPDIIKAAAQQQVGGYEKFIGNMTRGEATGKSGAMNRKLGGSSNTRRNDRLKPGQVVGKRPDNTETIKNIQKQRQKSADQISERGSKNIQESSKAIEDIKERNLAGAITYDENGNPVVDKKKKRAGDFKNWMLDLEVAGLQMGGDALVGVGTGGLGGMASMFARAGGMAMDEAERAGASRDQAIKYGLAIGGVEALTEKIGAVASPLRKVYGKGVTDTLMEKIIGKMAAKTTAGEIGQRTFMSALSEGLEEMVAEGVEPEVANKIYADTVASTRSDEVYNDAISKGYSEEEARRFSSEAYNAVHQSTSLADIFRAGSIGAAMGGILGGAGNVIEAGQGAAIKDLYGKDGIREMAKKAKDSDDDTVVARATAILDQIDNGGDVTAGQANAVFNAVQQQEAKDDETMRRYDAGIYAEMRRNGYESPLVEDEENGVVGLNRIASDKYQAVMGEAREAANEVVDSEEDSGAIADAIAAVMTGIASPQQVSMFTTSNPQARAVFESVTGETLPKSNAQMREKLFAMSARNYVETAREETDYLRDQINGVLNIDMTQDYGSSGQSAFADVMEDEAIDPRDNNKTVAASAFEDYYRAGALGIPMEQILQNGNPQHSTLSMEQKQAAYEAGIRDAQAQTSIPAGSAIAMGERLSMAKTGRPTGMLYVELSDETKPMFTGSQQRMYRELAKRLHINIHIVDDIVDDEGNVVGANGYYNKGEVYLSMNNDRGLELVFGHEVTHLIKASSPEAYAKLEELVRDRWEEQGGIDEAIKAKQEQYNGAVGQSLSESDALEEIIADATYEMFGDPEFVAKICAEEKTLGKTILYAIRTILANIRAALASSGGFTPSQNAQLLSQLDILSEFEDLWLQGLRDAARAEMDNAKESKYSVREDDFVRISPQRMDSLIGEYAQPGNVESNYSKAWIATINPRDFLTLTISDEMLANWPNAPLDEEELRNTRQMPRLTIDSRYSHSIIGHEGRHRMLALMNEGYTEVPVVINDISEANKTKKEPMDEMDLYSQDFGYGAVNSEDEDVGALVDVYDVIPINEKNRAEIERIYGGDEGVRFSVKEDSRVMYTPSGVEVVQNPTDSEYRSMREDILKEYPWLRGSGEVLLRKTYDEEGNTYYWDASSAIHAQVEPYINEHYKTRTSQQWKWYESPYKDEYPVDYSKTRFSVREPVEQVQDLIAVHNLTEDKLKKVLNLGGFPMPSIAVTNLNHENFGDISLLFGSETIDPRRDRSNKVYSADAWTPTVPETEYEADHNVVNRAYNTIKDLIDGEPNYMRGVSSDLHYQNVEYELKRHGGLEEFLEVLADRPYIQYAYLKSQGEDIAIPQTTIEPQKDWKDSRIPLYEELLDNYGEDGILELRQVPMKELYEREDIKNLLEKYIPQSRLEGRRKAAFGNALTEAVVYNHREELNTEPTVENDYNAANRNMKEMVDKSAELSWLRDLFDGVILSEGVYNGKDPFTPSGNSRSFKQLHYPATVDGIVQAMKAQGEKNISMVNTVKTLRADTAKSFKSLAEIRKSKGKLKDLSEEQVEEVYNELDQKYSDILSTIFEANPDKHGDNPFFAYDSISETISECAQDGINTEEGIIKKYSEYGWNVSKETANDILQLLDAIENMPVNMFEAKPRRAVGFDEVKAAILPESTSEEVKNQLSQRGIPIIEYNPQNDGERAEKVNLAADEHGIKFSVREQSTEPTPIPNEEDAVDYANGDPALAEFAYDSSPYAQAGKAVREKSYDELKAKVERLQADKRLTHGRVLDTTSIREDVENMLRTMASIAEQAGNPVLGLEGKMNKANARLVNDIIKNAKHIYKMMKSGREEEAVIAAMNVADDIVERIQVIDDAEYDTYKEMKKYLRETPITISEEDASNIPDFGTFKKNLFGKVRIVKEGGFPVDSVYEELMEMFPGVFDEEVTHPADQLMAIVDARESFEPYDVMLTAEEREQLLKDTTMELLDIIADGEPWRSWADKKSEQYQNKVKMLQERHREALRSRTEKERARAERLVQAEKTKAKEKKEKAKDKKERLKAFGSIEKNHKWLSDRLLKPTDDKHIPEDYKIAVADLLMTLDLQTERSKALEEKTGRVAQKTFKFRELLDAYEEIANPEGTGILEYDDTIVSMLKDSLAIKLDGKSVDALDTATMREVDTLLKAIVGNIKNVNKAFAAERDQTIDEMAAQVTADCNHIIDKRGTFSERKKNLKRYFLETSKVINIGMKKPREFFTHLGQGMTEAYMEIRHGEDKHFRNMQVLRGKFESIFKQYNNKKKPGSAIEKWRDTSTLQTFELENGESVKLNIAQVMSLYCLSKREQALGHIYGSGIVPSKVEGISGKIIHKKNEVEGSKVMVTYGDVMKIIDSLTEEQRTMADQLQALLNNEVAAWGNETSMLLYNYEKFTEKNYFPIKSDDAYLDSSFEGRTAEERIRNFGFTKGTITNANNPIVIADIFEVVTDHCNKMSLYNSFAAPLADFTRLYNSKFRNEDGTLNSSVKDMITKAYGKDTHEYIQNFMADVNNNTQVRPDETRAVVNKFLANYKRATIGMNMRVAVQQPTAIVRAFDVIDPKYFVADKQVVAPWRIKRDIKEMCDHCPIALWKSWGHNDVDMARDLDDIMMNKAWSRFDIVTMGTYGALDIWTWSKIWNAVKREIKAKNPGVEVGSDEYWDLCNERASEVFDRTQVVDSVLHRSQTMRSKDTMTKMISSFMAEPTTTFNMLQSDIAEARDLIMEGEKGKAAKKLSRCMTVFGLNAAAVSAAAAVIDLIRGKEPDDDDKDKEGFELWYANFLNNFIDNANPIKMIPYPSTAWDVLTGTFGSSNMAFEGWESLGKGMQEFAKFLKGDSKKTQPEIMWMVGDGIGNVLGIPIKSIDKDYHALMNRLGISFATDGSEEKVRVTGEDGTIYEFPYKPKLSEKFFNMLGIDNGSGVDDILNKFGLNLTEEEKRQQEINKRKDDILKKCEGLSGEEREKKLWSEITGKKDEENLGITSYIEDAKFYKVDEMKKLYLACGGDEATFNEKVIKKTKTAYKKTIGNDDKKTQQMIMYDYMQEYGMSEADISEVVYSSDTAREFKKAFALNDEETGVPLLEDLFDAGLTDADYDRLCDNASRSVKASDYATGEFDWPTNGTVTSGFGHRSSPGGIGSTNHQGMDIGAPTGTPVSSADGGKVISAGWNGGYGNCVIIDHGNGYKTLYGHLSGYEVKQGQIVKKNQQIGKVGSTGNSTGPHLHFGVMENDHYVNPANYLQR